MYFRHNPLGRGAVHQRGAQLGEHQPVQGVRVAGTQNLLRLQPRGMGMPLNPAHEGGLSAAGPALDDVQRTDAVRVGQLVVQGIKTCGRVAAQEVLYVGHPKASSKFRRDRTGRSRR